MNQKDIFAPEIDFAPVQWTEEETTPTSKSCDADLLLAICPRATIGFDFHLNIHFFDI